MPRYEVRLVGKRAKLGEVAAADVGKLLLDVQTVVARAAGVAIGRRVKATGRWERAIEDATRLRLVELRRGSLVAELELPLGVPSEAEFDVAVETLGDLGWTAALGAVLDPESADIDIVLPFARLADDLAIGDRYDHVEFGDAGAPPSERVKIDREARGRLSAAVRARRTSPRPPASVAGLLVEADFEKKTAHVRAATGDLVELVFDDDLADEIYEALRKRSEFEGDVTYDPVTNTARSVRLRRVTRTEQLLLGDEATEFWRDRTVDELIADQGKEPVVSFDDLRDESLTDEEFERFVATFE